jgi:hypothetical protein
MMQVSKSTSVDEESKREQVEEPRVRVKLSRRITLLSVIFTAITAYVLQVPQLYEDTWRATTFTMLLPSMVGILFMLILMFVNLILARTMPKVSFTRAEILAGYILIWIGSFFAGGGYFAWQFSAIAGKSDPFALDALEHLEWFEGISALVIPRTEDVMLGLSIGGESVPWGKWFMPIVLWTLYGVGVFFVTICLGNLVRKRWTEHEHLRYPLILPVLSLSETKHVESGVPLWKNKLAYLGLLYPVILFGSNIAHRYLPFIPVINDQLVSVGSLFPDGFLHFAFATHPGVHVFQRPLVMGVMYLAPLSITLSALFFYALDLFLRGVWHTTGMLITTPGFYPRVGFMPAGMFVYGIIILWMTRNDLKAIFRKAFTEETESADEPLSYRMTVLGGACGVLFLLVFSHLFLGIRPLVNVLYYVYTLVAILAFGRVRADSGIPVHRGVEWTDANIFGNLMRFDNVGKRSLAGMSVFVPVHFGGLSAGTGMALESYRLADDAHLSRRSLTWAMLGIAATAIVVSFVAALSASYELGWAFANPHARAMGIAPFDSHILPRIQPGGDPGYVPFTKNWLIMNLWSFVSAIVTPILVFLNNNFIWWPLHPIGYLIGSEVILMNEMWFSFAVAGTIKFFVNRYGGTQAVQKLTPIFYGFIIGDVVMRGLDILTLFFLGS